MQQLNLYCSTVLRSEWGQGYILFCWSTFPRSAVNRSGACLCDRLRPHELVCSHTSQTCSSPIRRLGHVLPWPDWKQTPSHHLGAWFIGVTAVMSGFRLLPVYAVLWERTWGFGDAEKKLQLVRQQLWQRNHSTEVQKLWDLQCKQVINFKTLTNSCRVVESKWELVHEDLERSRDKQQAACLKLNAARLSCKTHQPERSRVSK